MKLNENYKTYLAYMALSYLISAFLYLLVTFFFVGSPWKEAVRALPAETRAIRDRSVRTRALVYASSAATAFVVLAVWRPFTFKVRSRR